MSRYLYINVPKDLFHRFGNAVEDALELLTNIPVTETEEDRLIDATISALCDVRFWMEAQLSGKAKV